MGSKYFLHILIKKFYIWLLFGIQMKKNKLLIVDDNVRDIKCT